MKKFIMHYNLYILTVFGVIILFYAAFSWSSLAVLHRCICLFDAGIILHLWEEGKFPGGFTEMITEKLNFTQKDPQFGSFVTVTLVLLIGFVPLFFSNVPFLIFAGIFLGYIESFAHIAAIKIFDKKKPYTPGMEKCDVCICTGESDMVKAAYSSGKPAFGASPGNVQAIIDTDVKFGRAIPMIIEGRCFDNGIICSSEQTAVIPSGKIEEAIKIFEEHGTYYASRTDEVQAIRRALFHNGELNKALIGKSAAEVAAAAGIQIPEGTRMILVKADFAGDNDDLAKRKMAPVQALYTYDSCLLLWTPSFLLCWLHSNLISYFAL